MAKEVLREKFIAMQLHLRKQTNKQISSKQPTLTPKTTRDSIKTKPKVGRRKEIREEIETKKTIEKYHWH